MPRSMWLKEYYSRITEEYKFSMERKDRVTDWSIGIFFIALVVYAELLTKQVPSVWRIYLIVGLLCFIMRLFSNSCLAYAYLEKWRHLLDLIEKHWMANEISLDSVKNEIQKHHYTPRTTEKRTHFIKGQLLTGFILLFLFPFFLLLFEIYSNPQDLNTIIPISFLIAYYVYESFIFSKHKALSMPSENVVSKRDTNKGGKTMTEEEQVLLGLIRRYDTKIATHIGAIIAVTFGSFAILSFLRGAGLPPETWSGKYLLVVEILLICSSYWSVLRAVHYSAMIENLKSKSQSLYDLENTAFNDTIKEMPWFIRRVLSLRRGKISRTMTLSIAFSVLILWMFVVIAVLTLP